MNQPDLFNKFTEPLARNYDPPTSHQAARAIVDEGKLGPMRKLVLRLVREHPGQTGSELDSLSPGRKDQAHKRTRELEKLGLIYRGVVRPCSISGRQAATWWPIT